MLRIITWRWDHQKKYSTSDIDDTEEASNDVEEEEELANISEGASENL